MNATHWKSGFWTRAALATLLGTGAACVDARRRAMARSKRGKLIARRRPSGRVLTPNTQFFIPAPNAGASRQFVDLSRVDR